jgi:hypothetical protein
MELSQIVAICVAAIVIIAAIGWLVYSRQRSRRLQEHFGPEYERRVTELEGNRRRAESELTQREARVRNLKHHPLSASDRARFVEQWQICQARFVNDPAAAVEDADRLVMDIMHARGYKVEDPNDRLADLCAAYPRQASDLRAADTVLIEHHRHNATTEDLRKAFIHFRSLFDEILGGQDEELKRAS